MMRWSFGILSDSSEMSGLSVRQIGNRLKGTEVWWKIDASGAEIATHLRELAAVLEGLAKGEG